MMWLGKLYLFETPLIKLLIAGNFTHSLALSLVIHRLEQELGGQP